MFRKKSIWPAIIIVLATQTAALAWMVADRMLLIKNGREVMLKIRPVDPRSLFRGDYVILNPDIANIRTKQVPKSVKRNDEIFLVLQKAPNGVWSYLTLSKEQPTNVHSDRAFIRGRVLSAFHSKKTEITNLRLKFGIESYFVPEGTGKALEKKVNAGQIRAIVALDAAGNAALKGLEIDGERRLDPLLF